MTTRTNISPSKELWKILRALVSIPKPAKEGSYEKSKEQLTFERVLCFRSADTMASPALEKAYRKRQTAVSEARTALICACFPIFWLVGIVYLVAAYIHLRQAKNLYLALHANTTPLKVEEAKSEVKEGSLITNPRKKRVPGEPDLPEFSFSPKSFPQPEFTPTPIA